MTLWHLWYYATGAITILALSTIAYKLHELVSVLKIMLEDELDIEAMFRSRGGD